MKFFFVGFLLQISMADTMRLLPDRLEQCKVLSKINPLLVTSESGFDVGCRISGSAAISEKKKLIRAESR